MSLPLCAVERYLNIIIFAIMQVVFCTSQLSFSGAGGVATNKKLSFSGAGGVATDKKGVATNKGIGKKNSRYI